LQRFHHSKKIHGGLILSAAKLRIEVETIVTPARVGRQGQFKKTI
jgi:hypothetical protein